MTDFSKIKTLDELDYQTERLERRASIQRERLDGHVGFVVRQYHYIVSSVDAVIAPIREKYNEYRSAINVFARIVRVFFPKKRR